MSDNDGVSSIAIRRHLRPGDPGRIIAQHGELYSREHRLDPTFEGYVGAGLAAVVRRGWPATNEGVWIVELAGAHAGSLALTDEGDGLAMLRWFVFDPALRGKGLGRRLVGELIERAREEAYETIGLETFSELRTAASIYRRAGFELRSEDPAPRWGRARIVYQRYELSLQARAQSSSASSAGSSARPFSVSA